MAAGKRQWKCCRTTSHVFNGCCQFMSQLRPWVSRWFCTRARQAPLWFHAHGFVILDFHWNVVRCSIVLVQTIETYVQRGVAVLYGKHVVLLRLTLMFLTVLRAVKSFAFLGGNAPEPHLILQCQLEETTLQAGAENTGCKNR